MVLTGVATGLLGLAFAGPTTVVAAIGVLDALLGSALGLFASAFATSEFQAVQFLPALVFPQLILGGLLAPTAELPRGLQLVSDVLPLTYTLAAVRAVSVQSHVDPALWNGLAVIAGTIAAVVAAGAVTLRRRTG